MTPCIGIGRLLGHRYRARYSTDQRTPEWLTEFVRGGKGSVDGSYNMETTSTYHRDVCERCGDVVNREAA